MAQKRNWLAPFVFLVGFFLVAAAASAQQAGASIAGVARDASGGVLPGVTVEAASPALIEKVRAAVTDSEGRYNVTDLRPGTYSVSFTLAGFSVVLREGIILTSGFTATVNGDLRIGGLEETITVTGASPVVDTQSVKQQAVISNELLSTLPSGGKAYSALARLIPGMTNTGNDSGGASGLYVANQTHQTTMHGKGGTRILFDGMQTQNLCATGFTSYITNPATVEETAIETGGISAESNSSGVSFNMIPKEGSNLFQFGASGTFTNGALQGENLNDELRARGLTGTNGVRHFYDMNFTIGGPIKEDKIWFFAATRGNGSENDIAGIYFNKTQGTPHYTPDLDRPAFRREWLKSQSVRITWQVNEKNKLNVFADPQSYQVRGIGGQRAPEAQTVWSFWPNGVFQGAWNSPVTSKFLLEAGVSMAVNGYPYTREITTDIFDFVVKETDITIFDASTGFRYNAANRYLADNRQTRYAQRFAASYVTGSHSFKAGIQVQQGVADQVTTNTQDQKWVFVNAKPVSIEQWATPYEERTRFKAEVGVFVQDKWTVNRLTLNYGLRWEHFNGFTLPEDGSIPLDHKGNPVRPPLFIPTRSFAAVKNAPNFNDINPRIGGSYDLFGDGRTAIKGSLGRYVGKMGTVVGLTLHPVETSINRASRTWTDDGNFIPDCDLTNFAQNGECGAINNVNFGKQNPNARTYAKDLLEGYGNRDFFWDVSAEVQQEIGNNVSMTVGYYRNWSSHFGSQSIGWPTGHSNNLAVDSEDFDPYCVTAPTDPGLPGGGGYEVCGLYDVRPAKFGQGLIRFDRASNFGDGKSRTSDFLTLSLNTRLAGGRSLGASLDTGRTVDDLCFVIDSPQSLLNCRVVQPWRGQTQLKVFGNYPLPGGFAFSGVLQNVSGIPYNADWNAPTSEISKSLGRNLSACGTKTVCSATASVPLVAPWTLFEKRRTMVDLRFSKVFPIGNSARLKANFDVYNAFNSAAPLTVVQTYGGAWRLPSGSYGGLMNARLVQIGGELSY